MLRRLAQPLKRSHQACNVRQQGGSSLIEIMVSLLLVAFGFLGIGALFNLATATSKSASSRLIAGMLAQDYADLVRANNSGFSAGLYDNTIAWFDPTAKSLAAPNTARLCSYPNCTAATAAAQDNELFKQRVKAFLPAGDFVAARETRGNTRAMNIWILWVEGKSVQDVNNDNDACPDVVRNQRRQPNDPYPRCMYLRIAL